MLLPVVFLLSLLLPCAVCDIKLMRVNGKVIGTAQGTPSDSNCLSNCYYNSTCFLVYLDAEGLCTKYSYLDNPKNLSVVAADDGSQVYIKVSLPNDTCPSSLYSTNLTYNASNYFSYTWKPTANGWTFPGCADGWHLSIRSENLTVCMKGFYKLDISKSTASSICKDINSVLIGVQTVEESQWMKEETRILRNKSTKQAFFWIDGVRNCTGIESGCKWFTWSDNLTTGNASMADENVSLSVLDNYQKADCLVIINDLNAAINDVRCGVTFEGVFCGYKLN